ncbi:hypothetical protein CCACVL1_03799 [Corchorus capsularis]|uniref:Uncharacterized protein n=1 Tax=Corchorus capsularis TaxID=210143 RepID=A0A1R3JX78_COCAP|nr:hypothetical protein CCACVL1_03799 [Corchorus capsularis]
MLKITKSVADMANQSSPEA